MAINSIIIVVRSISEKRIMGAMIIAGSSDKRLPILNNRAILRALVPEIILVEVVVVVVVESVIVMPGIV
jgi:hypothetical protein